MEYLIFGIISLLLIIPIVYFLPVGFTKRGKLLVLVSAYIIFIIGLAARAIMEVWQTGIVLILLAIGFTYILANRFERQLFEHNKNSLDSESKEIRFELEDDIEKEILSSKIIHGKENPVVADFSQGDSSSLPEEIVEENQVDSNPIVETLDESIEMEELTEGNSLQEDEQVHEDTKEEPEEKTSIEYNIDDLLKELEMELENKNDDSNDGDVIDENSADQQKNEEPYELDQIEVIEDISHIEPEHNNTDIDSLQVNNEDVVEEDTVLIETEIIQDDEIEIEDLNPFEPQPENGSTIDNIETDALNEATLNIESTDLIVESEPEDSDQGDHENSDATRQLLFNTMVSQIRLYRNQLSSTEYEKLIIEHLHPQLSDHDYYTFVSLLIDHYIETKQYDELSSLISQNMNRFEKYPVILQEIKFLLKEYCKI